LNTFISLVTGARKGEVAKTLASFMALFVLLSSYYMVKPLRSSQFLKDFNADWLPFFFLFTAILSLVVTKIFSLFYQRVKIFQLIPYTYLVMMACKVLFFFYLPHGGRLATVFFYLWASVYFLLATSLLWGCINYLFSSAEGERCYGFIAIGAMLGGIAGSQVSMVFSQGSLKDYALLISALTMGSVLLFLFLAVKYNQGALQARQQREKQTPAKSGFFADFRELWGNRYVRAIAVIVYAIAAFNTVLEFQSQKIIDEQMAQQEYLVSFAELNQTLNQASAQPADSLNQTGFQFVFALKNLDPAARQQQAETFLSDQGLPAAETFLAQYEAYRDQLEGRTRKIFAKISFYQGILGISLLFFASRFLFKYVGLRFTSLILPCFYLVVMLALFFPVNLLMIEIFLVVGYGLNYSLNRAVKELLYTKTSTSTLFQLKPLIDGPIRRLGDVTMAIFKLALTVLFVHVLQSASLRADQIFVATSLFILAFWLYAVWYVGGRYDALKKAGLALESEAPAESQPATET